MIIESVCVWLLIDSSFTASLTFSSPLNICTCSWVLPDESAPPCRFNTMLVLTYLALVGILSPVLLL